MPGAGRYTVRRKLADGGMAEIFLGSQHGAAGFERPVIVKRIRAAFFADPHFRNMLIDEAHIAMSLNHSNIVQVLDLGEAGGRYFLILELVDGWDLNQILFRAQTTGMPVPPELALYVTAEVCRALAYAHGRRREGKPLGIIHRDISPHNILVSEQGEVKLTDFGIATAFEKREKTIPGMVKGKVGFMSPEQAGGEPLDPRSDLFSVGTMLYLMVTGQRPFTAPSDLESLLRTKEASFPHPQKLRPELPPELCAIILKVMQKVPAERYASAEEMLHDVERVQRAAFAPAGQTELTRWLTKLTEKDGILPASKAPPPPPIELDEADLEPLEGTDLILSILEGIAPDAKEEEVFRPIPLTERAPAPQAKREWAHFNRHRQRLAILTVCAAVVGAGWIAAWQRWGHAPRGSSATAYTGAVGAVRPSSSMRGLMAISEDGLAGDEGQAQVPRAAIDAGSPLAAAKVPAVDAGTPVVVPVLALAQPHSAPEVEIADPSPDPAPPPEPEPEPAEDKPEDKAGKNEVISVKIGSTPPGARVKINQKVYGPTPVSIRFRSGLTYDLVLDKEGFEPSQRRFYAAPRRNQSLQVPLKKKKSWWPF